MGRLALAVLSLASTAAVAQPATAPASDALLDRLDKPVPFARLRLERAPR